MRERGKDCCAMRILENHLFGASRGPRPSVTGLAKPGQSRIRGWPGCVQGQLRTQAIRGWPGPPTDNPPHAKSPAVHCKDRVLDSIILLIRISYNNKSVILALPTTGTRPKTHIHTPTRAINIHTPTTNTHTPTSYWKQYIIFEHP